MWTLLLTVWLAQADLQTTIDRLAQASEEEAAAILDSGNSLASRELARALSARGDQFLRARNPLKAEKLYRTSMSVAARIDDPLELARARFGLGIAKNNEGEFEVALQEFEKVLVVYQNLEGPSGLAKLYNSMAVSNLHLGNMSEALAMSKESLRWSEASGPEDRARGLFNLGNAYVRIGDYRQALATLEKSLAISETEKISLGIAFATNSIGRVHEGHGNFELALDFYLKSLKIKEESANYAEIIDSLLNIASVYQKVGQMVEAQSYLDRAVELNEDGDPAISTTACEPGSEFSRERKNAVSNAGISGCTSPLRKRDTRHQPRRSALAAFVSGAGWSFRTVPY